MIDLSLFDIAPAAPAAAPSWTILNWGLGVDSTAILLRLFALLENLEARGVTGPARDAEIAAAGFGDGFTLDRFAVVVAMTGSEWPTTGQHCERHILPMLARWEIRLVQVARSGPLEADGVTVLDDSTRPARLHLAGGYRLFDELAAAGTVPQLGGVRKCSLKAKGTPLDRVITDITGGRPYRQIMGFEAGECSRADKDARENTATRTGVYPLIWWGWDRDACERYIHDRLGVWWPKSACTFCVFALANREGQARVLAGFAANPDLAWEPLLMETIAQALNPAQTLMKGRTLYDLLAEAGQGEALRRFEQRANRMTWALVEVRRVMRAPGNAVRSVRVLATGGRADMRAALHQQATTRGRPVETSSRHARLWLARRTPDVYPHAEHLLTVVPALVADKEHPQFAKAWAALTGEQPAQPAPAGEAGQLTLA